MAWEGDGFGERRLFKPGDRPESIIAAAEGCRRKADGETRTRRFVVSPLLPSHRLNCAGGAGDLMKKIIVSALLLSQTTAPAWAGPATGQTAVTLPETVVTASRGTPLAPTELATAATVYTRQDIERLQVKTLPDLLKGSLGVDIAQTGGYGQVTSLFMRGAETDHVLVLVDGIKVGSITVGTTPFELIPIDQVERVEIIRGPQSGLYGSEAIGGVIQIFTRKGEHTRQPKFTLEAGGGSWDTAHTAGSVSGQAGNTWYNLGVSHLNSQGFNNRANADPDADGHQNTGLNARVGHRFNPNTDVEAFFLFSEGSTEFDAHPVFGGSDHSQFVNQVVGITGNTQVMEGWHSNLILGQSRNDLDTFLRDGRFDSRFNTTRWNASWLNTVQLHDRHRAVIGADYRLDTVDSGDLAAFSPGFNGYAETSRYDTGVFTELHSQPFERHFFNAALRWDKNQAFGHFVTGNVGWRYNSRIGISPFARFGNAFKAPTFNELYWPNTGFGGGNPNLKPEQAHTYEVGVAGDHNGLHWELRGYHTDAEQLIIGWPPVNAEKARIQGLESQISMDLWGWHNQLALNLLNPEDLQTGERLIRRFDRSLTYDVSRKLGDFNLGARVLAQGDRPDRDFNTFPAAPVTLKGFVTVDLRAAYAIDKRWSVDAKLNNLLDEHYQTVYGYHMPDRNFFLSMRYTH